MKYRIQFRNGSELQFDEAPSKDELLPFTGHAESLSEAVSILIEQAVEIERDACAKKLKAAEKVIEAARTAATPIDIIHAVYPKCVCPNCKVREALFEYDALKGEEK